MSDWHAFIEDDDEGNVCICLQDGKDEASRELHEMVEFDIVDALPGQDLAYLREAEQQARERNSGTEQTPNQLPNKPRRDGVRLFGLEFERSE